MAKLSPVFKKGGVVTAASASGICDGAGAVIGNSFKINLGNRAGIFFMLRGRNPVSRNELNLLTFYHFSVASEEAIEEYGLVPLARIVGYGVSGCEPTIMGIGPVPATRAMCKSTGINLVDVDQIEINEAFGAQTLACAKELEIPLEKLNTCGGAIALGHPLAASGSRISAHIVHKLRRNGEKYGIGSACIGGGQGISILFEAM
jgi:acetyl-CoA acyltransferase 2